MSGFSELSVDELQHEIDTLEEKLERAKDHEDALRRAQDAIDELVDFAPDDATKRRTLLDHAQRLVGEHGGRPGRARIYYKEQLNSARFWHDRKQRDDSDQGNETDERHTKRHD